MFTRYNRLIVLIVILALFSVFFLFADNFTVSFAGTSNFEIKYSLPSGEQIDTSIINVLPEGQRINVSFLDYKDRELQSLRCYHYNAAGNRLIDAEPIALNLQKDDTGNYFFFLPQTSAVQDIAIEPLVAYKNYAVNLSDLCEGGIVLGGSWSVNGRKFGDKKDHLVKDEIEWINDHSFSVSAVDQYSVKYTYDQSKYYLVSTYPASIASETTGEVVFKIVEPENNQEYSYEVNLKQYVRISVDKNDVRKIIAVQTSAGEKLDLEQLSQHGFKSGETIIVTTRFDVIPDALGLINNGSNVVGNERFTSFSIPEKSISYDIKLYLQDKKTREISVTWNIDEGIRNSIDFSINVGDRRYDFDDYAKSSEPLKFTTSEDENLIIELKRPADNTSIELEINGVPYTDTQEGLIEKFPFGTVESIDVFAYCGYRLNYASLNNSKEIDVSYVADGSRIKDNQFLKRGTIVSIYVKCPAHLIPKNIHLGNDSDYCEFTVTESTTLADFRVSDEPASGIWIDPEDYVTDRGFFDFYINGQKITSKSFLRIGDRLSYSANPNKGFRFSENDNKKVDIDNSSNEYLLEEKLKTLQFYPEEKRTVELCQPDFGGRVDYYNDKGEKIEDGFYSGFIGEYISAEIITYSGFSIADKTNKFQHKILDQELQDTRNEIDKKIIELEANKINLSVQIVGNDWTKDFSIVFSSISESDKKEDYEIYNNNRIQSDKVTGSRNRFNFKDKISLIKPFDFTVKGYSLGTEKLFKATVTLKPSQTNGASNPIKEMVFLTRNGVFTLPAEVIAALQGEAKYEDMIVKIEKVDGFLYEGVSIPFAHIEVLRNGQYLKEKDGIQNDDSLEVIVEPSEKCIIVGDSRINVKGANLKNLSFVPIRFVKEDEYGTYSYSVTEGTTNKTYEVTEDQLGSNTWFLIRSTDTLNVVFKVNDRYSLDWDSIVQLGVVGGWYYRAGIAAFFGDDSPDQYTKHFVGDDLTKLKNKTISFDDLKIKVLEN